VSERGTRPPGTVERIAGADLTDPYDCNVYVIYGRDRAVMVDAGGGRAPLKVPPAVDTVILTHLHADHASGARALGARGLRILAHPWTAEGLAAGDEERAGLTRARAWGVYPPDQRLEPWAAVECIDDGASLDLGGCRVDVVATPGHASGHISLMVESRERSLVAGDLVFREGTISLQVMPDCNIDAIWQSIERVRELEPERLYAGHLTPVESGAVSHLDLALTAFRAGRIPRDHG
jgi:glyoxylase-like metal-dependent hydrolase (beta-lactamase superfamily II)